MFSLGSGVVGRMLVHMMYPFLKLADAHTDISKTVGGWFITPSRGLFRSLGILYVLDYLCYIPRPLKKFLVNEYALVTGKDRWALN